MNANVVKFLEMVSGDENLQTRVNEINEKYPEREENAKVLVELAKEMGIDVTVDELLNSQSSEMSDEELEQVSGGKLNFYKDDSCPWYTYAETDCMCPLAGGGTADEYQKACACVLGGAGEFTAKGKSELQSAKNVALLCVVAGYSATTGHIRFK